MNRQEAKNILLTKTPKFGMISVTFKSILFSSGKNIGDLLAVYVSVPFSLKTALE